MQKFKIGVSKGGKKYTLILSDSTEIQARERVHKEGYSILSIEKVGDGEIGGHKYVFLGEKEGNIKRGKILGDDIFKAYLKLKRDLGYDVMELYTENDENIDTDKKRKIIQELQEEYSIFMGQKKEGRGKKMKEELEKNRQNQKELENFYLKKELDETYKLIDFVLEKIKPVIIGEENLGLNIEQKDTIKDIYNSIIKLKKTTNISKLREIGETALLKIGELELRHLEKTQNSHLRSLLKDTNKLLKKIGSKEQFIEKEKDIVSILKSFIEDTFSSASRFKKSMVKTKEKVDESSYSYIKNERLLKKYREKLKSNTRDIWKNILSSQKREKLFLRRNVIKQNIILLVAKKRGVSFSYTFLKKGYAKFFQKIIAIFQTIRESIFFLILFYSFLFIIYISYEPLRSMYDFSYQGLFYLIIILFTYFLLSLSRNLFSITFSGIILFFIILFGVINF